MRTYEKLYIDGTWVPSDDKGRLEVVNATTEEVMATVPEGDVADVDRAVASARRAFPQWSQTSVDERAKYLTLVQEGLEARKNGDPDTAIVKLGRAVQLAVESDNKDLAVLLERVVEVDDAATGRVRLKSSIPVEDEMTLDTRSTKTARVHR